jgi:large conductance mechanosensitive channel
VPLTEKIIGLYEAAQINCVAFIIVFFSENQILKNRTIIIKSNNMPFFTRFKEFAIKGNVLDLAVGIIIGAAFTTVTQSLVNDIIMPPVGKIIDNVNFSNLYIPLDQKAKGIPSVEDARKAGAVIAYGNFLQNVINFLIISLAVFLLVNLVHSIRHKEAQKPEPTPPAPSTQEKLLIEIRDALKALQPKSGNG